MKKQIIIAEDNDAIRGLLVSIVSDAFDAEITEVDNAESLVEKVTNNNYDFILTDNEMKGSLKGIGAIKAIRAKGIAYPIYLMSGTATKEEALSAGAEGFIQKPFKTREVADVLGKYLK